MKSPLFWLLLRSNMKVEELKEHVIALITLIKEGKILEAFERFYDDDIVMDENRGESRCGKDTNRSYIQNLVHSVESMERADVRSISFGPSTAAIEWIFEVQVAGIGKITRKQVTIQEWKNNKIVCERFYYPE